MDDNHPTDKERDLIEMIGATPLRPVPDDLTDRIMSRVSRKKSSKLSDLWAYLSRPKILRLRPAYALGVAVLILASFYLGKSWQTEVAPVQDNHIAQPARGPEAFDNPTIAYAIGRTLLQSEEDESQALAYLQRASILEPDNPEFAYWEGIGYWTNGETELERRSYVRGLSADPDNIDLLINLGHSYLGDKQYDRALETYNMVLQLSPDEPSATYNSGLIYRAKGMVTEEIKAWKNYLAGHRTGTKAFRAVERLNGHGDHSFREYQVGYRKVIVNHQALLDETLPQRWKANELSPIASMLNTSQNLVVEIVAFVENDIEAARSKALDIKDMLNDLGGTEIRTRIKLSWFDSAETITLRDGTLETILPEGILLFGYRPSLLHQEDTI